jgi:uracil-DNA glycosylase family 4
MIDDRDRAVAFDQLTKKVQACVLCSRMQSSGRILGASSGHIAAPLMFIGEAPGRRGADDTSIPFHGDKSGENFERLISQVGISRYDCFITNAVLCNPKDEKGNNATPNRNEVLNCRTFLRDQIDLVNPKLVVTLGSQALQALKLIEPHDFELASSVRRCQDWYGRRLIPLYHPGQRAMLHRSFLNQLADYQYVVEQLSRLKRPRRNPVNKRSASDITEVATSVLECSGPISYFRLHKLVYLAEYQSVREYGERLSTSYVVRQKDGPYFTDLHLSKLRKAIPSLSVRNDNGNLLLSLASPPDLFRSEDVGSRVMSVVKHVVVRYQKKTDEQLKTAVYLTSPMRRILRREKRDGANLFNAAIDFLEQQQSNRIVGAR